MSLFYNKNTSEKNFLNLYNSIENKVNEDKRYTFSDITCDKCEIGLRYYNIYVLKGNKEESISLLTPHHLNLFLKIGYHQYKKQGYGEM